MELFLQSIANGLVQGGFFALFAVGLVLIFGVMGVVNFAHGELVMVGAFTIWVLHAQAGLAYIPAIGVAIVLVTAIGLVMERLLFRPTRLGPVGRLDLLDWYPVYSAGYRCTDWWRWTIEAGAATLPGNDGIV